ncbi:IS3 family transposase [Burkholderia cepacia]
MTAIYPEGCLRRALTYNHDRIKLKLKGLSPVEYRIRFA